VSLALCELPNSRRMSFSTFIKSYARTHIPPSGADHTSVANTFQTSPPLTSLFSFLTPASLRSVFLLTRSTESVIANEDRSAALDDLQFARRCRIEDAKHQNRNRRQLVQV